MTVARALPFIVALNISWAAHAQTQPSPAPVVAPAVAPVVAPAAAPVSAPYVLPWLLRSALTSTAVRWDNSIALYDTNGQLGATYVGAVGASFKVPGTGRPGEGAQLVFRFTIAHDDPPMQPSATIFANPVVGVAYSHRLPRGFRLAGSLSVTIPMGMGGGDHPDAADAAVRGKAQLAREGMENSIFGVNDLGIVGGLDAAYVDHGWTVQLEATLLLLPRVRGAAAQPDSFKINFTSGLFVGYFVLRERISLGLELHYQRYFIAPRSVSAAPSTIDNLTLGGGVRFHVPVGRHWLRCGVSYGGGLDNPMRKAHYSVLQLDCPFVI